MFIPITVLESGAATIATEAVEVFSGVPYLCQVVLQGLLQFHLGGSRLLMVGLSEVLDGGCVDMI